jgi:hypothetical protein
MNFYACNHTWKEQNRIHAYIDTYVYTITHTQYYNNMAAPNNCVGGSEQSCIPKGCGPHCGGGAVKIPAPATWYANQGHEASGVATTKLGAGPEFYNNMEAPHNCVGGSEVRFGFYGFLFLSVSVDRRSCLYVTEQSTHE